MKTYKVDADVAWIRYSEAKSLGIMSLITIAEDEGKGITVLIDPEIPSAVVMKSSNEKTEVILELAFQEDMKYDLVETLQYIYDEYLQDKRDIFEDEDEELISRFEVFDEIMLREEELDNAVYDFVKIIIPDLSIENINIDDFYEDLKEHFLEYVARKYDLESEIYRPTYVKYEDGREVVIDFPYEHMEFETPDYK